MKTKKATTPAKTKKPGADARSRKMEPLKSKELKNQRFDVDEDDQEIDPESIDENFKGFEETFDGFDEEDEDY
ncbi:MAG: hypothetical protein ABI772_01445 [Bacteroidota bacterium]